jgi:hypothetical protein
MDISSPNPPMPHQILPKHIALVLGLVMLATLILVAVVRYSGVDIRYADSPSQQVRLLRFADMDNGDIGVFNAQDGSELARFSGEQGFMRGALRAMARERLAPPTRACSPSCCKTPQHRKPFRHRSPHELVQHLG